MVMKTYKEIYILPKYTKKYILPKQFFIIFSNSFINEK